MLWYAMVMASSKHYVVVPGDLWRLHCVELSHTGWNPKDVMEERPAPVLDIRLHQDMWVKCVVAWVFLELGSKWCFLSVEANSNTVISNDQTIRKQYKYFFLLYLWQVRCYSVFAFLNANRQWIIDNQTYQEPHYLLYYLFSTGPSPCCSCLFTIVKWSNIVFPLFQPMRSLPQFGWGFDDVGKLMDHCFLYVTFQWKVKALHHIFA